MKITKGSKLEITHRRKGKFIAIASKDFDSDDIYSLPIVADTTVEGVNTTWGQRAPIPCRIELVENINILKVA